MRRFLFVLSVAVLLVILLFVPIALAQPLGPCNDADGDGSPSGREYAEHHVSAMAKEGDIGAADHDGDGMAHTPGSHRGFSACDPSG